ncbi:MAG: hypothetical protein JO161_05690 [Planctomycetaceae bacterium]|nr:hypothetical protein [Planctomycetaceae bacterium]
MILVFFLSVASSKLAPAQSAGRAFREPAGTGLGPLELPADWRATFWKSPGATALLHLSPKALANLVPVQAGIRFCRCPACGAPERDDPLVWSIERPETLTCRRCGVVVPNDTYPAKSKDKDKDKEVSEETIEVAPGVVHHYPYHAVELALARYPDERLYLRAKIDYETRKYLAKAALYAAAESRAGAMTKRDPKFALISCVIMLRLAQVYPLYAIHLDQPERPKYFEPARTHPPFRRAYESGKWEWSAALEVPLNLVMAYTLLRDDPAWAEAGSLLGDPTPERSVATKLLRASAEYARMQPEEFSEDSLHVYRGMLAVARLLNDQDLEKDALSRLEIFTRRGFYHDGLWRQPRATAHRRVVGFLEGWASALAASEPDGTSLKKATELGPLEPLAPGFWKRLGILALAQEVSRTIGPRFADEQVERATFSPGLVTPHEPRPIMLGGAGIARLAVGQAENALEIEVRGLDSYNGPQFGRLAMRLAASGVPLLDDLDDEGQTASGYELATAAHNTVLVDGLNQRETPTLARTPCAGSEFRFFAALPDFQATSADDPRAYPHSTHLYRHTVIASASPHCRYALGVFEVRGGSQHDQILHAAPGRQDRWTVAAAMLPAPSSLLTAPFTFVPSARPEQGRWFVQFYGEFQPLTQASLEGPSMAVLGLVQPALANQENGLASGGARGTGLPPGRAALAVRVHLLGDGPMTVLTADSPDRSHPGSLAVSSDVPRRASLIVRRQVARSQMLSSTFVTLYEPIGGAFVPLRRVGRVSAPAGVVAVVVESIDGVEYVLVNLEPGTVRRVQLPGGDYVSLDGLAMRVRQREIVLAGGTFAEGSGRLVSHPRFSGQIVASVRQPSQRGLGWFVTPDHTIDASSVEGKTLVVQHGDGTCHSWTLDSAETTPEGTRLFVREEPGFLIDQSDHSARYYQFPMVSAPGPHRFRIAQISRSGKP